MTQTPQETPPIPSSAAGKTWLKTGCALLAGLVLVLLLGLGAGLLFIRSASGERWISATLSQTLHRAGIDATIGTLRGPLPQRLQIRDLRLADAHGVWLEIPEATLELQLETLLRGQLTIRELSVNAAVLHRLPMLPETPASTDSPDLLTLLSSTQELSSRLGTLLDHVTLDALRLTSLRVDAAVLHRPGQTLTVSFTGGGPLTNWLGRLQATLAPTTTAVPPLANTALQPSIAPVPPRNAPPAVPGTLTLAGTLQLGNRGDWLLGTPDAAVLLDLHADMVTGLCPTLTPPDANPPATLRIASLHTLLTLHGARLALAELTATTSGGTIRAQDIALTAPRGASPLLTGELAVNVDDPSALSTLLTAALAAFDGQPQPQTSRRLPFTHATVQSTLSGSLDKPQLALELGVTVPPAADATQAPRAPAHLGATLRLALANALHHPTLHVEGTCRLTGLPSALSATLSATSGARSDTPGTVPDPVSGKPASDLVLSLEAEAGVETVSEQSTLRLRTLKLHAEQLQLFASGDLNPETGALNASAQLTVPALQRLAELPLLAPFAAQLETVAQQGAAEVLFTVQRDTAQHPVQRAPEQHTPRTTDDSEQREATPFTGTFQMRLRAMHWGMPQVQGLLGEELAFHLGFSALPAAHAGNPLPELSLQDITLHAGQISGKGTLRLIPDTPRCDRPDTSRDRLNTPLDRLDTPRGTVDLDLALSAKSLAALNLSGSVATRLRVQGSLLAPRVEATLSSPRLGVNTATLDRLNVAWQTPAFHVAPLSAQGTLKVATDILTAHTAATRGTRATLDTAWTLRPDAVSVRDFVVAAAGLRLKGALESRFSAGHPPRLDGRLEATLNDWTTLSALGNLPLQGGKARLQLTLDAKNSAQQLVADWSFAALRSGAAALNSLSGRLQVRNLFTKQDITLHTTLGAGACNELNWTGGSLDLTGTLRELNVAARLQGQTSADLRLTLNLPAQTALLSRLDLAHAEPRHRTQRAASEAGSGERSKQRGKSKPALASNKRVGLHLEQPARLSFKTNAFAVDALQLALLPQGHMQARARLGSQGLLLDATVQNLPLGVVRPFLNVPVPDGLVAAQVALSGSLHQPQGTLALTLTDVAYPQSDMTPAQVLVRGQLHSPAALVLDATVTGLGKTPLVANLTLPLAPGLRGLGMSRPLSGSVRWEGSLAPLWRFVPLANSSLTGQAQLNAQLSGTPAAPVLSADLHLAQAAFEDVLLGLFLADITADMRLDSNGLSHLALSAGDGQGGTVRLEGTLGTLADGLPLLLRGELKNLSPLHRNDLSLTLSGEAHITGPVAAPAVQAAITVNKGAYQILPSFGTSIPTLEVVEVDRFTPAELFGSLANQTLPAEPASGQSPQLDAESAPAASGSAGPRLNVTVTLPNRFFVRGNGLESEWKGQLAVTGAATSPVLTGGLTSLRGQFGLLGKQFALTKGLVRFSGGTPPDPLLDIVVSYVAASITAQATLTGTASAPILTLSSQPPLPQDEIVAQVLFGQSAASLGRMEALQLASQLALLAGFGNGGPSLLEKTRDILGIDVLRVGSVQRGQTPKTSRSPGLLQPGQTSPSGSQAESDSSIPALEVGKYVLDDVYVGLKQGMNGDTGGVRVEVDLTPSLNLEGSTTPQGSELGINWKRDY